MICYNIKYELDVIVYTKDQSRYFGSLPTEKMVRTWRKQEENVKATKCSKYNLCKRVIKWPELGELKIWVLDQRRLSFQYPLKRFCTIQDLLQWTKISMILKRVADL